MKEKLILLLQNAMGGCSREYAESIANYLINHGVTIQRVYCTRGKQK